MVSGLDRVFHGNMDAIASNKHDNSARSLDSLLDRAQALLHELKIFHSRLQNCGKHNAVEFRIFRRGVKSEIKQLDTIARRRQEQQLLKNSDEIDDENSKANDIHALRSSNLPFYETVWSTAKSCQRVTALCRRIYWSKPRVVDYANAPGTPANNENRNAKEAKQSAIVDVVAEDGLKWIKASTITNKRLLFEMAKEGWAAYEDGSSDDEEGDGRSSSAQSNTDMSRKLDLVKLAYHLIEAASTHRSRFKHPRVHFILPNVIEYQYPDIDAVLHEIRSIGVNIICPSITTRQFPLASCDIPLSEVLLDNMVPASHVVFTETLNIDCTILLALISDISHIAEKDLPPSPENRSGTYHTAILRQIECEAKDPLVPNELYGVLENRHLVCTSYAAKRMHEIVRTMGTESEKQRAAIFLATDEYRTLTATQLRDRLAKLSCHTVPKALRLPLEVKDFNQITGHESGSAFQASDMWTKVRDLSIAITVPGTPTDASSESMLSSCDIQIAIQLQQTMNLTPINKSVFLYGWINNIVTVTSNKVVATSIMKTIDQLLDEHERQRHSKSNTINQAISEPEFVGPKLYICETARSLVGKEKQLKPVVAPKDAGSSAGHKLE